MGYLCVKRSRILWKRVYDKTWDPCDDIGYSIVEASDGGYVITGKTVPEPNASDDVYILKVNSNGEIIWGRSYGGDRPDGGNWVDRTSDGGYIVAGYTVSFGHGHRDIYLIRVDSLGDSLWAKTYGGESSDEAFSVQQTIDKGFIIAGRTYSFGEGMADIYLIKVNRNGDTVWTRTYGGRSTDWSNSVRQTTDGGYIIVGGTYSFGSGFTDVYLIKIDGKGKVVWEKTFGGKSSDVGKSIQQTSDGGFIIVGSTWVKDRRNYDLYIIKTDYSGNTEWEKKYGGEHGDIGNHIIEDSDGGYVIVGHTYMDVLILKLDGDGNMLWSETIGEDSKSKNWQDVSDVYYDIGYSVLKSSDGAYVIVGSSGSSNWWRKVYLIKLKPEK